MYYNTVIVWLLLQLLLFVIDDDCYFVESWSLLLSFSHKKKQWGTSTTTASDTTVAAVGTNHVQLRTTTIESLISLSSSSSSSSSCYIEDETMATSVKLESTTIISDKQQQEQQQQSDQSVVDPPSSSSSSSFDDDYDSDKNDISRFGHNHTAWKRSFTTCPKEIDPTWLDCPTLPDDFPTGTYYRNGHGRFDAKGDKSRVAHFLDGDGMMVGATFCPTNKRILFRNRFVRTNGYRRDMNCGNVMSRPGVFGTKVSGGFWHNFCRFDFKNVANTNCLYRNHKLYALWEAGWPYVLDPLTLRNDYKNEPHGHNFNGLLHPGQFFAAHYKHDTNTGNIVTFGVNPNPFTGQTKMMLYEFDNEMKSCRNDHVSFIVPSIGIWHDFCITDNWHIFILPPASIGTKEIKNAMFGKGAISDVVVFDNEETSKAIVYMIPRMKHLQLGTANQMKPHHDHRIKVFEVPYHFSFHFANAYEEQQQEEGDGNGNGNNRNGNIIIDSIQFQNVQFGNVTDYRTPLWETVNLEDYYPAKYVRTTINPDVGMIQKPQILCTRDPEFPSIPMAFTGKQHRYVYTLGSHKNHETSKDGKGKGLQGSFVKIDTQQPQEEEVYEFLPHEFVGEPVFVPKKDVNITQPGCEDKGYLISYVANGRDLTTDLVIFDVEGKGALCKGPVTRLTLPTYIPPGLHGIFVDGLTF